MRFSPGCNCCVNECNLFADCCSGSFPSKVEVTIPDVFTEVAGSKCSDSNKCPDLGNSPYILDSATACEIPFTDCGIGSTCYGGTNAFGEFCPTEQAHIELFSYNDKNWCNTDHELYMALIWRCKGSVPATQCQIEFNMGLSDDVAFPTGGGTCQAWSWIQDFDLDLDCINDTFTLPFDGYGGCVVSQQDYCNPTSGLGDVTVVNEP